MCRKNGHQKQGSKTPVTSIELTGDRSCRLRWANRGYINLIGDVYQE